MTEIRIFGRADDRHFERADLKWILRSNGIRLERLEPDRHPDGSTALGRINPEDAPRAAQLILESAPNTLVTHSKGPEDLLLVVLGGRRLEVVFADDITQAELAEAVRALRVLHEADSGIALSGEVFIPIRKR